MRRKPNALIQLLDELQSEVDESSVVTTPSSKVMVIENDEMHISAHDAELLLHSEQTVDRFFEAIGRPADAAIELYGLKVDDEVFDALEKRFVTTDYMN